MVQKTSKRMQQRGQKAVSDLLVAVNRDLVSQDQISLPRNLFIFLLMTPTMVLAGFTIAIAGYVFGASLAWVFGLPKGQIIAVAIETSFQNASIAFILLKISLPEPYGELAAVAPVAQVMRWTKICIRQ